MNRLSKAFYRPFYVSCVNEDMPSTVHSHYAKVSSSIDSQVIHPQSIQTSRGRHVDFLHTMEESFLDKSNTYEYDCGICLLSMCFNDRVCLIVYICGTTDIEDVAVQLAYGPSSAGILFSPLLHLIASVG